MDISLETEGMAQEQTRKDLVHTLNHLPLGNSRMVFEALNSVGSVGEETDGKINQSISAAMKRGGNPLRSR